jgi:hypothetical protein
VGSEHSRKRFGKGFEVSNQPTRQNMEGLATLACGAFEEWVYKLFRDPDGLSKPGNLQLYGMLCKIRSRLAVRLKNVLANSFSSESEQERHLFGGLYFAATGHSPDQQCFVKGVIDRVIDLEEDLEWTLAAQAQDRRFHLWSQFGMFLNFLLVIGLIGIVLAKRYYSGP